MIVTDVNVLIYALRREAPDHRAYADSLATTLGTEVALVDQVLLGLVRIVTNPRVVPTRRRPRWCSTSSPGAAPRRAREP